MTPNLKNANKQGIALIIVIGFLSILLILAVAFVVSMRTESLATRGYLDNIKTRQLMNVALAHAMDDIEQNLARSQSVYAAWSAHGSTNATGSSCTNLLDGSAMDYVPNSLLSTAQWTSARLQWQDITNDQRRVIGRYTYLAVDCSGLLDANCIGGLPRTDGMNSLEISPTKTNLLELTSNTYANMWMERSSRWIRYESVPELYRLGINTQGVFLSRYPSDLFTYSYFPATQFLDFATGLPANSLYIGGNSAYLSSISGDIEAQFVAMGIPNANKLTQALLDYVDPNNIPLDLFDICVEPTPLINEVVLENKITKDIDSVTSDEIWTNAYRLRIEFAYPFVGTTNDRSYQAQIGAIYTGVTPSDLNLNPPNIAVVSNMPIPSRTWVSGEYYVLNTPWSFATVQTNGVVPNFGQARVQLNVRLSELGAAGGVVDQFQPPGMYISNGVVITAEGGGPKTSYRMGKAVNDPRLNWDANGPTQWSNETETAGQLSLGASNFCSQPNAPGCDGPSAITNIYIRNGPLETVGELGFLLYSKTNAWRTIRLLDDSVNGVAASPVLDRFTLVTNQFLKGLVNPNTLNTNVLRAVFSGVQPDRWPGENADTVSVVQAGAVATAIATNTGKRGGPFTNLSSIATLSDIGLPAVYDSLQKEGIIRNSAGLLSPRQNLFTIVLAAQTVDSATNVAGEQRAVALVWRDPYPTLNPYDPTTRNHSAFVRFFKWLVD